MKRFLLILMVVVLAQGDVYAKDKKSKGKSEKKANPRKVALQRAKVKKYRELTDELSEKIHREQKSIDSKKQLLETKQGQRKKSYYEKSIKMNEKKLEKLEAELEWTEKCYQGKATSRDRRFEDPFKDLNRKIESIPGGSGKK